MDGVTVGFVGAVTEELPSLVTPGGIANLEVRSIVESVNTEAAALTSAGADVVVMLVHEGSSKTDCAEMGGPTDTTWGNIISGVSNDVDAIVSGHTHLAYNCTINDRPVVSAGQYGMNLNQLNIRFDPIAGQLIDIEQNLLPLMTTDPDGSGPGLPALIYPSDDNAAAITAAAVAEADVLGAAELGELGGAFFRAKLANATTENRGGESTLGNLVATVQKWATSSQESGAAQIAFMNPGGLRKDMVGTGTDAFPRTLTYKQAAEVQPFANTLFNIDMTGDQIETVLEQQWQRTSAGAVPTRPFLKLGVSDGFTYTYTETPVEVQGTATYAGEVTGMWLDGVAIDPAATYSVTVNSFLVTGGDNFFEFANGANRADTGKADLQAMVDYMAAMASSTPLPVDYAQTAVEVSFPEGAPASYAPGDSVAFDLGSLAMAGPGDQTDSSVDVYLGDDLLGTAPVDNTLGSDVYDYYGTASVDVALPSDAPVGETALTVVGATTGTEVTVPITVEAEAVPLAKIARKNFKIKPSTLEAHTIWKMKIMITATPDVTVAGKVQVKIGKTTYSAKIKSGEGVIKQLPKMKKGPKDFTVRFLGSDTVRATSKTVTLKFK